MDFSEVLQLIIALLGIIAYAIMVIFKWLDMRDLKNEEDDESEILDRAHAVGKASQPAKTSKPRDEESGNQLITTDSLSHTLTINEKSLKEMYKNAAVPDIKKVEKRFGRRTTTR